MKVQNESHAGFGLIELLVTLAIAAILLSLAVPSYHFLISRDRSAAQVEQLVAAINYARSEAVYRHTVVTLCKSENGKTCSGTWKKGWIVFVDKAASGQINPQSEILRIYTAISAMSDLKWSGQRSEDYLQMDSNGATRGQAGTFYYTPDIKQPEQFTQIIISQTGRIRIEN